MGLPLVETSATPTSYITHHNSEHLSTEERHTKTLTWMTILSLGNVKMSYTQFKLWSASGVADSESDSRFVCGDFSRSSHISDLKMGIPVATLPGA